jgi:hypothetical protein
MNENATASVAAPGPALPRIVVVAFGVVAGSILASQIVVSRLLAATLGYYFGFMIVSLVMVGLGAGALFVQLAPNIFTPAKALKHAATGSIATGVLAFVGTMAMLLLYPRLGAQGRVEMYELGGSEVATIAWCFFPMYFSGGTVVALMLMHARSDFYRLYAVDLLGAAGGAVMSMVFLEVLSPSETALGALSLLPALAGACFALGDRRPRRALVAMLFALAMFGAGKLVLTDPHMRDPEPRTRIGWPVHVSEWNSFSNVSIYPGRFFSWSLSSTYHGPKHQMLSLMIDGVGGTQIVQFDGKPESLARYDYLEHDLTQLAHELVPAEGKQLIIGPGGCVDVLQSYRAGRRDITAVEINPLVVEVVNERLRPFSGAPCKLPGVQLEIENGRTFIKRTDEAFDLITLTWVDAGGSRTATALNEDYLYTVDAYVEFLQHLEPEGYIGFLRALGIGTDQPLDSARALAIVLEALRQTGATDPKRHVMVALSDARFYHRVMVFVMAKRTPIAEPEIAKARSFLERMEFTPLWMPDGSVTREQPARYSKISDVIYDLITSSDPSSIYESAPIEVEPPTDDRPFYFIQTKGPNREPNEAMVQLGDATLVLATLVIPFLLVPLVPLLRRQRLGGRVTWSSLAYYSLLGVAFMMVEIELFHMLGLALGRPTLSLAVVLGSLLVFSGLGSLCAPRIMQRGSGSVLAAFIGLIVLLTVFTFFKGPLLALIVAQSLPVRVLTSIALIAPIGLLMGTPMSMGMTALKSRPDLMVWGWALNGAFSVFGSVLAMYFATTTGIAAALTLGTACYAVAGALIVFIRREVWGLAPASST